jgi:FeS assembly SUF system protein
MTDPNPSDACQPTAAPKISLSVLPYSGKVDQLRWQGPTAGLTSQPQPKATMNDYSPDQAAVAANAPDAPVAVADLIEPGQPSRAIQKKLLEAKVIAALHKIYDPEIPIDIYELGLIYDIDIRDDDSVKVLMTLTAPACPVAGSLPGQVEQQIETIPEIKSAEVVLVWDPPWSRDRMSEAALLQLGML